MLYFCSPEAVNENGVRHSSAGCLGTEMEVWALGVTLYYAVFGTYPFRSLERRGLVQGPRLPSSLIRQSEEPPDS